MLEVFGIPFRLYGLMIGLGVLAGGWVSARIAKREGIEPDLIWDGLMWVTVGGVVGARMYHVIDLWVYYSKNFFEIFRIWNGGLGIFGGMVGGATGLLTFVWWRQIRMGGVITKSTKLTKRTLKESQMVTKISLMKLLDIASFGVPVGQAIGRWGNYFNQELFGRPTSLPWGIFIRPENRPAGMENFSHFQPLFLYESLLNLMLFLGLLAYWFIERRRVSGMREVIPSTDASHGAGLRTKNTKFTKKALKDGSLIGNGRYLGIYLVGYGVIRLVLEPMRIENWKWGEVPMASIFSVFMILWGLYFIVRSKVKC